jgi:hypothetical protein
VRGARLDPGAGSSSHRVASLLPPQLSAPMRNTKSTQEIIDEELTTREKFWRDQQSWLKEAGYMFRARYQPDWIPSWIGTNKFSLSCEDGVKPAVRVLAPASR